MSAPESEVDWTHTAAGTVSPWFKCMGSSHFHNVVFGGTAPITAQVVFETTVDPGQIAGVAIVSTHSASAAAAGASDPLPGIVSEGLYMRSRCVSLSAGATARAVSAGG